MTGAAEALVFYPDNLMRTVAAAPQQDWAALVADHLATLLSNYSADRITPLKEERFSEIQGLIRTRLYPESSDEARTCVCRPVPYGLTQRIVLDSVNTIAQVTPDLPGRWNVGEDELFAVAERNTPVLCSRSPRRARSGRLRSTAWMCSRPRTCALVCSDPGTGDGHRPAEPPKSGSTSPAEPEMEPEFRELPMTLHVVATADPTDHSRSG